MLKTLSHCFAMCTAIASLTACGGGSASDSPPPVMLTIQSQAAIDGLLTVGNSMNVLNGIRVGDREGSLTEGSATAGRGFVSFDITAIPSNAQIQEATLRVFLDEVGGDPLGDLGPLLASHVDIGNELNFGDFDLGTIDARFGQFVPQSSAIGWKTIDVTSHLQSVHAMLSERAQFRLELGLVGENMDDGDDYLRFEDGDNALGSGNEPELVVVYALP